ncbi:MAG TPA: hypothetical protein VGD78_01535 [Chthoniobacterales bacterium]
MDLDYSLFPDREPPTHWTDAERAQYLERLCRQVDFGIPVGSRYVIALRAWKDTFDRFLLLDSPAYHALRAYFRWTRLETRYRNTGWKPPYEIEDLREGRPPDGSM